MKEYLFLNIKRIAWYENINNQSELKTLNFTSKIKILNDQILTYGTFDI